MTKPKPKILTVEETKPGYFAVEMNSRAIQDATPDEFSKMLDEMVDEFANEPGMQARQKDKSAV